MWFLRVLVATILLGVFSVACSTANTKDDSGADLLNQAMTPAKPSTNTSIKSVAINDASGAFSSSATVLKNGSTENAIVMPLKQTSVAGVDLKKESTVIAVQPAVQPEVVKNKSPVRTWKILLSDKVISNTLERWAEQGGYQLVWKSDHDFEITSSAVITGTMRDSFNLVLLSFVDSNSPIKATWYKNKVIVITSFNE